MFNLATAVFLNISMKIFKSGLHVKWYTCTIFSILQVQVLSSVHNEPGNQREISIKSPAGTIIGYIKDVDIFDQHHKVAKFLGIPYAKSPTGQLRFQKPVAREPFPVPLVAKQHGLACLQQESDFLNGQAVQMGEDCLNLNVYRPEGCSGEKLPVMVWFHGGGFATGSSDPYVADQLAVFGSVIVVTVNYRLSVWGFLSLGTVVPGNNGLWDQHLALKWIQENILYFGGDKDKVTIFGQSAGAASVVYQSMYEGNQGLFHRAIAQSSSIISPWTYTDKAREDETIFGRLIGCELKDFTELFQCINSTSNTELLHALEKMPGPSTMLRMSIIPTIDGEFVKESTATMLLKNSSISKAGQNFFASLDFLSGATSMASTVHALLLAGAEDFEQYLPVQEYFDNHLLPLITNKFFNTAVPDVLLDVVRAQYMYKNWNEPNNERAVRENYIKLMCDICHNVPLIQTVQFHASISDKPTYIYRFDERPSQQICTTPTWAKGSHHSDELPFVFGAEPDGIMSWLPGEMHRPNEWERWLSKVMMMYWTNFAKSGNPNHPVPVYPEWPQYNLSTQKYLDITRTMTERSVKSYLHAKSANFWLKVVPSLMKSIKPST